MSTNGSFLSNLFGTSSSCGCGCGCRSGCGCGTAAAVATTSTIITEYSTTRMMDVPMTIIRGEGCVTPLSCCERKADSLESIATSLEVLAARGSGCCRSRCGCN